MFNEERALTASAIPSTTGMTIDRANLVARTMSESLLFMLERRFLEMDPGQLGFHGPDASSLDIATQLRMLRVTTVGDRRPEETQFAMRTALEACRFPGVNLVYAIRGDGAHTSVYFGVRSVRDGNVAAASSQLRATVEASVLGLRFARTASGYECPEQEVRAALLDPIASAGHGAAFTGVPSASAEGTELRSLDAVVEGLQGRRYTLLVIAEPLAEPMINEMMDRCFQLGSELHGFVRTNVSMARAMGVSTSRGTSETTTTGAAGSGSDSLLMSMFDVASAGLPILGMARAVTNTARLAHGFVKFGQRAVILEREVERARGARPEELSSAVSRSEGTSESQTDTETAAREMINKGAEYCEQLLDAHARRLRQGRGVGFWNVGVFLLSEDLTTVQLGQALLRSSLGGDAEFEPVRVLPLHESALMSVQASLWNLSMPRLDFRWFQGRADAFPLGDAFGSLATPLHSGEVARIVSLPRREVPGLARVPVTLYGLNPSVPVEGARIPLGNVVSPRGPIDVPMLLDADHLDRHAFVTGVTGSGKTNTMFVLLEALYARRTPFLIIEPAKAEYRALRALDMPELQIFTAGDERASRFRINPMQFIPGVNLLTHLDNIRAVFNASFPMYASMPYLLEQAVIRVFVERGWDLSTGLNKHLNGGAHRDVSVYGRYMPRLSDVYLALDRVVQDIGFAQEASSNYLAALKARIGSLLTGGKGAMFDTQIGLSPETLFERPTVLELRGLGDDEEKCFLMAVLLTQLYAYREHVYRQGGDVSVRLGHVLVFEEAHRLLRNVSDKGGESANARGKAVETFANMLAELRQYGQGIIVLDQVASKLVPDVVKNTNLKIFHRVVAPDDRNFVGDCMGLSPEQKASVARLGVGEAVVVSDGREAPVLVQVRGRKLPGLRLLSDDELRSAGPVAMPEVRRSPACVACARPCAYLSTATGGTAPEYARVEALLRSLLFAAPADVGPAVIAWRAAVLVESGRLSSGDDLYCLAANCVDHVLARLAEGVTATAALVRLEEALMHYLRGQLDGAEDDGQRLADVRSAHSAAFGAPPRPVAGCDACPRRCHFGWVGAAVRRADPELLDRGLAPRVAQARSPDEMLAVLRGVVRGRFPELSSREADGAVYCWLSHLPTQGRTRERVLELIRGEGKQS